MGHLDDQLAESLTALPGVEESASMFGERTAWWVNGKEIAHFEASGVIEVRLTRAAIRDERPALKSDERVVLRPSGADWLTVRFSKAEDLSFILRLVAKAEQAHRPGPGVMVKPPPTGADLERRRRFH